MVRSGIYARISEDSELTGLGVKRQEEDSRALCVRLGWEVADLYVDNDLSAHARQAKRPAYERMLRDITAGKLDAIVAYQADRLYRRVTQLESLIELCEGRGVELATVGGRIDLGSSQGRLVARIMASAAQHESELKSERVKRKMLELAQAGKLPAGGHRMYGYAPDGRSIVEEEAAVVWEVAARCIAGESLRSIVSDLNVRGVPAARGGRWKSVSLRGLLSSPRIAGLRTHYGKVVATGDWPAILSSEDHEAIVAILRSRSASVGRPAVHLLSGIASCGLCLRPLYVRKAGEKRYYGCLPEIGGCGKILVSQGPVDDLVWEYVSTAIEAQGPWQQASASDEGPRRELDSLRSRLSRLEDAYLDGGFDKGTYLTRRSDTLRSISELESQLFDRIVGPTGDVPVREWLTELDLESRRQLIRQYLLGVRVGRGTPGRFNPSRVTLLVESVGLRGREVTELTPPSFPLPS